MSLELNGEIFTAKTRRTGVYDYKLACRREGCAVGALSAGFEIS